MYLRQTGARLWRTYGYTAWQAGAYCSQQGLSDAESDQILQGYLDEKMPKPLSKLAPTGLDKVEVTYKCPFCPITTNAPWAGKLRAERDMVAHVRFMHSEG